MQIDTFAASSFASQVGRMRRTLCFTDSSLQARHNSIQTGLASVQTYFRSLSVQAEAAETSLFDISTWNPGKTSTSSSKALNLANQIKRTSVYSSISGSVTHSIKEQTFSAGNSWASANASLSAGVFAAKGVASVKLWKEKKFDPELKGEAEVSLAALSGSASASLGTSSSLRVTGKVKGDVGAVYAKAVGVLSVEEQTLDLKVGAAAARGECSVAFNVFGTVITLTASGSVGSAEAGLSYSHKNKEWEFGSKLGFICGIGFKVNVNYS